MNKVTLGDLEKLNKKALLYLITKRVFMFQITPEDVKEAEYTVRQQAYKAKHDKYEKLANEALKNNDSLKFYEYQVQAIEWYEKYDKMWDKIHALYDTEVEE